jgi:hypothetical protein
MEKQIHEIRYWSAGNENYATERELHIPGLIKAGGKTRQKDDVESAGLQQDGGPPHFEGKASTFHDDNFPM